MALLRNAVNRYPVKTEMPLQPEDLIDHYRKLGVAPGSKVAVGVSGGADSLCLLLMTAEHFDVTAISVDHGLRPEAAGEVEFVAKLCLKKNIPHVSLLWDGEKPKSNIQAAARVARYELMRDWCAENGVTYLAVGHHQDDQAETLLLRLARGSGVYGLAAMPAVRDIGHGVSIVRPLLSVSKETLTATLTSMGQNWVEDPSNQSESYDRIKVRKLIADSPLDGLNAERLAATAERLRRTRSALEHYEELWLERAVSVSDAGYMLLDVSRLHSEPEEITLRGLASICRFFNGSSYVPRMEKLQRLMDALSSNDFKAHTLYGAQFSKLKNGTVLISRELSVVEGIIPLEESVIWDNRFAISAKGGISGLKISALGVDGWVKLRRSWPEFDQVTMPRLAGIVLPAIYNGEELQVVPHLGYNLLEDIEIKLSLKTDALTKK